MAEIKFELENIGGVKSLKSSIVTGKLNRLVGSNSAGKSSVMRGIALALCGKPSIEYSKATTNLTTGLLMRGEDRGTAKVDIEGGLQATISKSGAITANSKNHKTIYTTTLRSEPYPTALYRSIFDPSEFELNDGNVDNFQWLTDTLSEAGEYQKWYRILNTIVKDISAQQKRFRDWEKASISEKGQATDINNQIEGLESKRNEMNLGDSKKTEKLEKDKAKFGGIYKKRFAAFQDSSSELEALRAKNQKFINQISAAEGRIKIAKRRLAEAEELQEMDLNEERIMGPLRKALQEAKDNIASGEKINEDDTRLGKALDNKVHISANDKIGEVALMPWRNLVTSEQFTLSQAALGKAQDEHDKTLRKFIDDQRKQTMASSQADAARGDKKAARAIIATAGKGMGLDKGKTATLEKNVPDDERAFKAAKSDLANVSKELDDLYDSPEAKKITNEINTLKGKLNRLSNSGTMFEMRLTSLGMMANQSEKYTGEDAEALLFPADESPKIRFVNDNLTRPDGDIRSLLLAELNKGLVSWLHSTSEWVLEEAERQRADARRIFNNVGDSLFKKLDVSELRRVALNTDYELVLSWKSGEETGLTGASGGGELAIIAAAMLIAIHKAYTPHIPILMIDGVHDRLAQEPMDSFANFLSDYAKKENIAVVISELDDNQSSPIIRQ